MQDQRIRDCMTKISNAQKEKEHWEHQYRRQEEMAARDASMKMKVLHGLDSVEKVLMAESLIGARDRHSPIVMERMQKDRFRSDY